MIFAGADPDTKATGVAWVDEHGKVLGVQVCRAKGKGLDGVLAMIESLRAVHPQFCMAAAVEAQETVYSAKQGKNPRSIGLLSYVAGALVMCFDGYAQQVLLLTPQAWKGTVPKQIHQARICRVLGWEYETVGKDKSKGYVRPTEGHEDVKVYGKLLKSDWKHVMDAIGLALKARDQWKQQTAREARKAAG